MVRYTLYYTLFVEQESLAPAKTIPLVKRSALRVPQYRHSKTGVCVYFIVYIHIPEKGGDESQPLG